MSNVNVSMDMLNLQMRVQLKDKQNSTTREGTVLEIYVIKAGKIIDGRPVSGKTTKQVQICFNDGGADVVLTPENFGQYEITVIG